MVGQLTLVMPYYLNPGQLALQYEGWRKWPQNLKDRFRVVLVDDGSPTTPAGSVARPDGLPELEIYRVGPDIPWNQHGARNLGAHVAHDGWLLLTDMDHVLCESSATALFERLGELDPSTIYMLDRIEADTGNPTLDRNGNPKPHPNSFVLTRDLYWTIGGYDEDFCGIYGTDGLFKQRAFKIAKRGHLNIPLIRYWRDIVPDASTTTLPRKEGRDPGARDRVMAAKKARGETNIIKTLQFSWERVL